MTAIQPEVSLPEQARLHGEALWERDPDACCAIRKVAPQRAFLAKYDAWITGLHRTSIATRQAVQRVAWDAGANVVKVSPLAAWSDDDIAAYAAAHDIPHNPLMDAGYASIGCMPCTRRVAPGEDPRAGRWAGFGENRVRFALSGTERYSRPKKSEGELTVPQGVTIWLTGLSGAGKSTIAARLRDELAARGRPVEILDGDEVREHLSAGLGFSREDRDTNIARIAYVAKLLTRNGVTAITAAISPYAAARAAARAQIGDFVEVFVRCPLEELARRDVKGLYARALRGEIANFTGVTDPYEEPAAPDVTVDSRSQSVAESVAAILEHLERAGYLDAAVAA